MERNGIVPLQNQNQELIKEQLMRKKSIVQKEEGKETVEYF